MTTLFTAKQGRLTITDGRNEPDPANTDIYYYDDSAGTYTDKKFELINPYPSYQPAFSGDSADRLVVCHTEPFGKVFLGIKDFALNGGRIVVEYWDGSSWTAISHYRQGQFYPERLEDSTVAFIGQEPTEVNPIIVNGGGGWKGSAVYDPSVVYKDGVFHMVYMGYSGSAYTTGYATSTDGVNFSENASNPIYTDSGGQTYAMQLIHFKGQWHLYYGGPSNLISVATGSSITSLTEHSESPVIGNTGPVSGGYTYFAAWVEDDIVKIYAQSIANEYYLFESEDGIHFSQAGNFAALSSSSTTYPRSVFSYDGSYYGLIKEVDSAYRVVSIISSPDGLYWDLANSSDSEGTPFPVIGDVAGTTHKEPGCALFVNGRLLIYYTDNLGTSIGVAIHDVLNFKQSSLSKSGYISFPVPGNWQLQGHASLPAASYCLRIGLENAPSSDPILYQAYPVVGQKKVIPFEGSFSGPIGPKTFDEKLYVPRGNLANGAVYIEGPDDKFLEPNDISFEYDILDSEVASVSKLLTGGNPNYTGFDKFGKSTKGTSTNASLKRKVNRGSYVAPGIWTDLRAAWFMGPNDYNDHSGNRIDLFPNSEATFSAVGEHGLYTADFDGSANYYTRSNIGSAGENVRLTGAFTISLWMRPDAVASTYGLVAKWGAATTNQSYILKQSSAELSINVFDTGGTAYLLGTTSGTTLVADTWYHVVATYDGTTNGTGGGTPALKIYVNGANKALTDGDSGTFTAFTGDENISFSVGASLDGGGDTPLGYFKGEMYRVQVAGEALSSAKVAELYAKEATMLPFSDSICGHVIEPGEPQREYSDINSIPVEAKYGLAGAWLYSNAATDVMGSLNLTANGSPTYRAMGVNSYHAILDGSADYYSLANTGSAGDNVRFTGAFTIGALVYMDDFGSDGAVIAKAGETDKSYVLYVDTTGFVSLELYKDASNHLKYKTAAGVIEANRWYHIIATWDGTYAASGMKIYVNGAPKALSDNSSAGTFDTLNDSALAFTIGASLQGSSDAANNFLDGRISRVFAKSGALSSREVASLYEHEMQVLSGQYWWKMKGFRNPRFAEDDELFDFNNRDRGWGGSLLEIGFESQGSLLEVNQSTTSSVIGEIGGATTKTHATGQTYTPAADHWLYNVATHLTPNGTLSAESSVVCNVYKRNDPLSSSYLMAKSYPVAMDAIATGLVTFTFPKRVFMDASVEHVIVFEPINHSASDTNYIDVSGSSSSVIDGIAIKYNSSLAETTTTADICFILNCVNDSSIAGNSMIPVSMTSSSLVAGPRFKCLSFDGVADYLYLPNKSVAGVGSRWVGAFSVSAWIYLDDVSGSQVILSKYGNATTNRAFSLLASGAEISAIVYGGSSTYNEMITSGTSLTASKWHHILLTYDGTDNASGIKIWIDNVSKSLTTTTGTKSGSIPSTTAKLTVACDNSASSDAAANFFGGEIAELMFIPYALSTAEIAKIYGRTERALGMVNKKALNAFITYNSTSSSLKYGAGFSYEEVCFEPPSLSENGEDATKLSASGKVYGRCYPSSGPRK